MSHSPAAVDQLCRILSHRDRRRTLAVLLETEAPTTVRDLTTELVTREYPTDLPDVPADAVTKTYLALVHVHVPLLEDAELIEYDSDRKLIDGTDLEAVEPFLSAAPDEPSTFELAR